MSLSSNFSKNLSSMRKSCNSTLTEFAEEISVSRSYLQSALNGSCNPTLDTVEHIAEKLQVSPDLLLSFPQKQDEDTIPLVFRQSIREARDHLRAALHILEELLPEDVNASEHLDDHQAIQPEADEDHSFL